MFEPSYINALKKAVESEKHANTNPQDYRYNHHAREAFLLCYLNLYPAEQDMLRETIDDLLIYGTTIKLTPPKERTDLDHAKYPENLYLRREFEEKYLRKLRIKSLNILNTFGVIDFSLIQVPLLSTKLTISEFREDKNHALFDLLKSFNEHRDDFSKMLRKSLRQTGNRIVYDLEKELGEIVDSKGKKVRDISFRENSNPRKFFNFMYKNIGKNVNYSDIRRIIQLQSYQKLTVTQWVKQMDMEGFFVFPESNIVRLNEFETVEVTE